MQITESYLLEIRASAVEQRQKAFDLIQQANGAIAMIDVMIERLATEETSTTEQS